MEPMLQGDAFYYMAYRMLDKDGAVTYTHEMTHNSDREIYLGGYGRRNGLGPEFYAKDCYKLLIIQMILLLRLTLY